MAVSRNGSSGGFSGRNGNVVTYMLNGQWVSRIIGLRTDKPTKPVLAVWQVTKLSADFLKPVKDFIRTGFELETKGTFLNFHNAATEYNRLNAITGEYPDQKIDFTKVLLSKGKMPATPGVSVKAIESGLTFNWDSGFAASGIKANDEVMLLAYEPERKDATFSLYGGKRAEGEANLSIRKRKSPLVLETYISFIAQNRKTISDSIYTGQIIW